MPPACRAPLGRLTEPELSKEHHHDEDARVRDGDFVVHRLPDCPDIFGRSSAEQHEGGFAAAWTAIAGNGANQSAAAQAMLTDDMETGSVLTLRASSSASSGAGLSAASAAIDPSTP